VARVSDLIEARTFIIATAIGKHRISKLNLLFPLKTKYCPEKNF
jgi:hypothetical protein